LIGRLIPSPAGWFSTGHSLRRAGHTKSERRVNTGQVLHVNQQPISDKHINDAPRYDPHPGLVALGTRVEIEMISELGDSERLTFDLVPDRAADFTAGFLGASTPLARAIMGHPVGSVVPYRIGDMTEVHILAVALSERRAAEDAAEVRHAVTQEVVERAKLDEMVQLALTVNVKWGNYDPEGIIPSQDKAGA
jgi:transcription elongation GreA/GreB family factor